MVPPAVELDVLMVMVEVPPPAIVPGLNEADAPLGRPEALNGTLPVNELRAVIVTVKVVPPPAVRVWLAGEMAMVKSVTLIVTPDAAFALGPLVPVTVNVELAAGVVLEVDTVMVEDPAPVMVAGLKLAVAPTGNPATVGVITPLNPFSAVVDTV